METSSSKNTTGANGGKQQAPVQSSQRATSSSTNTTSANGSKQQAPTQAVKGEPTTAKA